MKTAYQVTDKHAEKIGGALVVDGVVSLSDAEAEHYLRMGAIKCLSEILAAVEPQAGIDVIDEETAGVSKPHPLDHDGDGRPGGSVKGSKRKKREDSGVTGEPPTNSPPEDPESPPMPYLSRDNA
jgi:hypothetical protein